MQKVLVFFLLLISHFLFAQSDDAEILSERNGFAIGLGLGCGVLGLNTNDSTSISFSTTLPNLKMGYVINRKFSLFILLPGSNYTNVHFNLVHAVDEIIQW